MGVECPKCKTENTSDSEFCKKCATPLPSSKEIPASPTETLETPKEELTTGSTFAGRYQIIEELGKGGMGKVYKAHDTEIKEKIALKLIKPEISADKRTIERFQNELKFARKISHRNVCRMYDLNKEEGSYYITMEYVSGEDLKSMIGMMGQLSGGKAISVARQVCEGLTEAHRLGVVHRDLKPQNIMIDREGNARIMDFGIARSLKAKGITGAGVMVGTPEYMSPEQAEVKEVDQRSDIYSLGVILYEMVTGRVPFEGETPLGVAMKHKSEMPKDPRELNSQTPEDLSRVILRCMEKDKEKRYQSGGELRAELENIEKGIPTTERVIPKRKPITSKEITVTFSPKKLLIPALVVVALVVAVVVILQLLPKKEAMHIAPTDKPSLAVMYFENNTGDENLDHWRKMLSDLLITDLAQSKHLRVLPGDRLFKILNKLNQLEAKTFSSDVLKEVASQGGVKYVLVGKYAKMEDTFRIDIMIQDVNTGELVSTLRTEARGQKDVFAKVDELTQKIKTNFNLSQEQIDGDFDYEVGKITTGSPEAFRYFSQAIKIRVSGKEQECLPLLERAISIDPEFALAYREMGMVYWNLGYRDEAEKHLQTAFELSDRLSDRDRFQIQGSFYGSSEKTYDKAIEAYNNLLKLYPDDHLSNHNLGLLYQWIDEWNKAAEQYEFLIKNGSEFAYSHANLASVYENMGYFEKAVKVYEYYLNNISDNAYIRRALAFNYRVQGKFDLALQEMDKALLLEPTHYMNPWVTGNVYLYMGDLEKAEKEYDKLLKMEAPNNARGCNRMIYLSLYQGKFMDAIEWTRKALEVVKKLNEKTWIISVLSVLANIESKTGNQKKALELLEEVWNIAVEDENLAAQRGTLIRKGFTYLAMGALNEAQKMADKHKIMAEEAMNKRIIGSTHHLQGRIEIEKGNYSKAVESIKKALPLLAKDSNAWMAFTDSLALAYYTSGDLEKARIEYEKMHSFTVGKNRYSDIYVKSFYMLGKVYQGLGDEAKARDYYEAFLDLWKDANPGIAEVEDARKRLAGLKS